MKRSSKESNRMLIHSHLFSYLVPSTQKTFEELEQWKKAFLIQIGQEGNDKFPMIVLANKVDLENREVTKREAQEWTSKFHIPLFETSAKEGMCDVIELNAPERNHLCLSLLHTAINVNKAFEELTKIILDRTNVDDVK
jgi:GTPase SAR1 family protein